MLDSHTTGEADIANEQIRLLFSQAINVVYGTLATVAVLVVMLWSATNHFWLLLWVVFSALINAVRMTFYCLYKRLQPGNEVLHKWLRVYLVITFFVGLIWGSCGLLLFVTPSYLHQTLVIITLGGVALIGISVHASSLKAYLAFVLPLMLPVAFWQISYGTVTHSTFGLNLIFFTLILIAAARKYNRTILTSLRLRRENIELAEHAQIASKAKSEFLANMSHEIRTPLTAIVGYAESALEDEQEPQERTHALQAIKRSSDHLLHIINEILDFSKIEANRLETEVVKVNYFELLSDIESLVESLAKNKGLQFRLNFQFPLPASLNGDPVRLKQVLLNLCSNAIKFTSSGEVSVTVGFIPASGWLRFSVKDTGMGMSPEQLEELFTPFRQGDSSITRRFGGTGLGLSLSKRLVELMHGSISVESNQGVGSCFEVVLPCGDLSGTAMIEGLDELNEQVQQTVAVKRKKLQGKVLLAEDNRENRDLLALILSKMGMEVVTAVDGDVAVSKACNENFDLIYMDMQMPKVSGLEATSLLRAAKYTGPIVALTANATQHDRDLCRQAGCNDFLTKPINRDRLYDVSARYLQASESGAAPILSQLEDDDPEIHSMLLRFVGNLPEAMGRLEQAYNHKAWDGFKKQIHDLKGVCGNYGYPTLSALAERIEIAFRESDFPLLETLYRELRSQIERVYFGVFPKTDASPLTLVK